MPNRIIKESICTSDSIAELNWFEEVLFYRLIVNCDDYGRFDGRTAVVKNRLFPLKDNVTAKAVEAAVNKLVTVGLVTLYFFEGKPYLQLPTWDKHQSIRAKKSKYPSPEDGVKAIEINCKQMQADVPVIQSESESEFKSEFKSESENAPALKAPDAFDRFWESYPKKVGKEDARKKFKKVKVPVDVLIEAVEQQKRSLQWTKENGAYIPNPSTWLNQGRWEDELVEGAGNSNTPINPFMREEVHL